MPDEKLEWYSLLDGTHSFRGMRKKKGETILLTEDEANKLGNRVRKTTMSDDAKTTETVKPSYTPVTAVSDDNANTSTTTSTSANSTVRDWSTTQDMKAPDVVNLINETDSKDELTALQEIEEKGQNRIGVLNAIKKRMGQIGG